MREKPPLLKHPMSAFGRLSGALRAEIKEVRRSGPHSCRIRLLVRGLTLHWVSRDEWLASRGYEIWSSDCEGQSWIRKGALKRNAVSQLVLHPFAAQVSRLGIQNMVRLSSGAVLCVADGVLYRSPDLGVSFSAVFSEFRGRRPLRMGICQDSSGRIFLGEYLVNRERRAIQLWRSDDDALTWYPVFTWPARSIAHIHFVQFDPYEQALWVGTGDEDHECQLLCSWDGGVSFERIGGGTQLWRAASVLFRPEALFWGTDISFSHSDQANGIIKMDRATRSLRRVCSISGPVYYSAQLSGGALAIGSSVERVGGLNDSRLHLYVCREEGEWADIRLWTKLNVPRICGPATITFPLSDSSLDRLLFNVNLVQWKYNGALFEIET